MKIVAGERKKTKFWAVRPAEGGPAEGSQGNAQVLDAPTKIFKHNTTQQPTLHTTGDPAKGGLGQGGSLAGRSMAPKTSYEQQIVPKNTPWPKFFGVKDGS